MERSKGVRSTRDIFRDPHVGHPEMVLEVFSTAVSMGSPIHLFTPLALLQNPSRMFLPWTVWGSE